MAWLFLKSVAYQFSLRVFIEVGTIVISILGPIDLAAQCILMRYATFVFVTGMGFWIGAVAIMGRAAGAGKRSKFVATYMANFTIFVIISLLAIIFFCSLRYPLAYFSTSIASVQVTVSNSTPLVSLFSAAMLLMIGSHSLVLSIGKVNVPTASVVFCEFLVGIPIAMILTFGTSLRLYGFYIGLVVSYSLKIVIIWTYYACSWNEIMATISDSNSKESTSELSPFLPKTDSVESTQTQSPEPEVLVGGTNGYGTADSSIAKDPYQTITNK